MGTLYLVPTPVGNLEDITARALRILRECDLILAEDTRTSGNLLRHFDIHKPMVSYHKFNEHQTVARVVERLMGGETIAVVSDAGTPGISDPGFLVAREAVKAGVEVRLCSGVFFFLKSFKHRFKFFDTAGQFPDRPGKHEAVDKIFLGFCGKSVNRCSGRNLVAKIKNLFDSIIIKLNIAFYGSLFSECTKLCKASG